MAVNPRREPKVNKPPSDRLKGGRQYDLTLTMKSGNTIVNTINRNNFIKFQDELKRQEEITIVNSPGDFIILRTSEIESYRMVEKP